ncbi:MAG TPA: hypothetical protein VFV07_10205 [Rhizomicrobium sp.]|nr:hypothetical protein [Rhizomicrobium sp.]
MSDEPDSLVLRYLRRIDERTARLEDDMQTVKGRRSSLEAQMALMRGDYLRLEGRVAGCEVRLDRIEKRLDLVSI